MAKLLSPLVLGSLTLKNRVVLAPLTRGRANPVTREPNDLIQTYYEQRASSGLIITEATAVSDEGHGWYGAPAMYTEEHSVKWRKIVDGVHAKGGVIFLQMWHMGRQGHPSFHATNEVLSASAIKVPGDGNVRDVNYENSNYVLPRALTEQEIAKTVEDYKESARLARLAGFDGVELHAANGYLIDQFLQSVSNVRTDNYGGSFENRYRFLKEVVEAVATVFPADRIGVRVSPNGGFGGMGSPDNYDMFQYVARELFPYGLAYLHVMDGTGFGAHDKCAHLTLFDMKTAFKGPIMGNVCYTKEIAEGVIRSGAADFVAFGRPYISNPDLVERFTHNYPLAPDAPYENWWTPTKGAEGYTDYPAYSATA